MTKIDFKKELKHLYKASPKHVVMVDVPVMNFLMVDGYGSPGSADFASAVEALFSLAYALKFTIKKGPQGIDYGVLPLEALWWAEDMAAFTKREKDQWQWTAMIMQPEYVDADLVETVRAQVAEKRNPAALPKVRFEAFHEGRAAQTLHVGPFSEEGPTVARVHDYIAAQGFQLAGKHHEIYLSDIRRAAPEKWKTLIRQPYE